MKNEAEKISDAIDAVIVFFSTGKDSIAMSHMIHTEFTKRKKRWEGVYLYAVPNLSFVEKILSYYEAMYDKNFLRIPDTSVFAYYGKKAIQKDCEDYARDYFGIDYVAYGYKASDSLARRAMTNHRTIVDAIDKIHKKVYPIRSWKNIEIDYYIKKHKLPVPEEYHYGFRDIGIFDAEALHYVKRRYPGDYEKILKYYPHLEHIDETAKI